MNTTVVNREKVTTTREGLSLVDFMRACITKWLWFVISLVVFVGIGVLYILSKEPVYERYEQILIKDQEAGGSISGMSGFSSLGLFSSNSSVQNELISISSPAVMAEVVKRLDLTMNYITKKGLRPQTLYGETLPIKVIMSDITPLEGGSFKCTLQPDGGITLRKFVKFTQTGEKKLEGEVKLKIGDTVKTPIGSVTILSKSDYTGEPLEAPLDIDVSKTALQYTIEGYSSQVNGDLVDEFADVIQLSIKDVNVERAVDILNEIVNVYNQDYLNDKNRIAKATSAFIDDRLKVIEQELGDVDTEIAHYRSSIGTVNSYESGRAMMEKSTEYEENIVRLSTELEMARYMQNYLKNSLNKYAVLPANLGIQSQEVETQIGKYNEMLLSRNALVANSSDNNPVVQEYDIQLEGMRNSLEKGIANQIVQLQANLKSAEKEQDKAKQVIRESPTLSLPLLSEQRQQKVKESLYLFLLEKREENELSQKFTADNTRIITPPTGSLKPVSPKKVFILAFVFFLGIAVPAVVVFLKVTGDTKVRSKKDVEGIGMPFAGEIPQVGKAKLKTNANSKKKVNIKDEKAPLAVVEDGKRDIVNEAFRVIRSNIEFMSKGDKGCHVVMLTSFNPGSGKSFISYNLALSFALKHKKVLLIDCDLRHGSSSMFVGLPSKGLTNYLVGNTNDWKSLVVPSTANANLEILPIGKIPPNPAELLENGRMDDLLKDVEKDFDYVFLDCPPVNIVVDTQIVGKYADSTLFVVRAGLLEKSSLDELNSFYKEHKFNHMSLILNGTDAEHSRYYSYGNYHNYVD